jgi:hypothetical protein
VIKNTAKFANWPERPANRTTSSPSNQTRWGSITEVQALDHVGITDVICLIGFYTSVSMTLAFYDVRAGAEGLVR